MSEKAQGWATVRRRTSLAGPCECREGSRPLRHWMEDWARAMSEAHHWVALWLLFECKHP